MHHLDRPTIAATDLRRQFLAENRQLLSLWRANVRREVSTDSGSPPLRSKENQLRKLGGGQPGETAAIVCPTEGQAPVAVKTVPAQVGDLVRFAAHGLHWVPEEPLYFTDLVGMFHVVRLISCEAPSLAPAFVRCIRWFGGWWR